MIVGSCLDACCNPASTPKGYPPRSDGGHPKTEIGRVAVTFASNRLAALKVRFGIARKHASLTSGVFVSSRRSYLPSRSCSAASLANRSARNLSVFSRTNRALAWYSVIAIAPSLARSSFLKLASARPRASSIPVVNVISYSADGGVDVFEDPSSASSHSLMLILLTLLAGWIHLPRSQAQPSAAKRSPAVMECG